MIEKAENSIWIFTPYLDFTLNKLLSKRIVDIEIVIVTCLEGDSLFQRGYQLKALKELREKGIVIKNLSGLHAKILLSDNKFLSLGSQNFTARGRKNKEAGFVSDVSFQNSKILETLNNWYDEAKIVNAEQIDALVEYITSNENELAELKRKVEVDVESILNEFDNEEQNFDLTKSDNYNTTFRYPQNKVVVHKRVSGVYQDYFSFVVNAPNDLSQWIKVDHRGQEDIVSLPPYFYFPSLNLSTMQLMFLRVHSTKITYMKSQFHLSIWSGYDIKGKRFTVDFKFLKTKTKVANIKITLYRESLGRAHLYYFFNAIEFKLVNTKFSNIDCEEFIVENLLDKPKKIDDFLKDKVWPRKFTTKLDQPEEIEKFLSKDSYKVGIAEFNTQPILVFEEEK